MSHIKYYNYPGVGEYQRQTYYYSQAARVGDLIECSGQGGWDPTTAVIPTNLTEEINQAFANVDLNLKTAGGKGWSQVYKMTTYHVGINEETMTAIGAAVRKWMPDHAPLWNLIGVAQLGLPEMHVEIVVTAHDPEGAKTGKDGC